MQINVNIRQLSDILTVNVDSFRRAGWQIWANSKSLDCVTPRSEKGGKPWEDLCSTTDFDSLRVLLLFCTIFLQDVDDHRSPHFPIFF